MRSLSLALSLGCLAAALPCQIHPDRYLVLVHAAAQPAAVLYEVDAGTGAVVALPSFPSDSLAPLALAIDPATREPVVALQGAAGTVLVRIHVVGQQVLGETVLTTLPGVAVAVLVPAVGDLFVATGGGNGAIWRVARQCCGSAVFWAAGDISALSDPVILPGKFWAARDLAPAAPTLSAFLDTSPGAPLTGTQLTTLPGARITGIHEFMANGSRNQMVADALGQIHVMQSFWWTLMPVALQPPIPAGGAVRLKGGPNQQVLVLGGAADPTLKSLPQTSPQAVRPVTLVAGPFAGTPVDFAVGPSAIAKNVRFGATCSSPAGGSIAGLGVPQLGNSGFELRLANGAPSTFALFAAGSSEREFLGLRLPIPLGTCELLVAADFISVAITDAAGAAAQPLPIPASPSLSGLIVYAQWVQDLAAPRTSDALALHVF